MKTVCSTSSHLDDDACAARSVKQLPPRSTLDFGEIPRIPARPGDGEYDPNHRRPARGPMPCGTALPRKAPSCTPNGTHGRQRPRKNWCVMHEKSHRPRQLSTATRATNMPAWSSSCAGASRHCATRTASTSGETRRRHRPRRADRGACRCQGRHEIDDRLFVRLPRARAQHRGGIPGRHERLDQGLDQRRRARSADPTVRGARTPGRPLRDLRFSGTTARDGAVPHQDLRRRLRREVRGAHLRHPFRRIHAHGLRAQPHDQATQPGRSKTRVLVTLSDGRPTILRRSIAAIRRRGHAHGVARSRALRHSPVLHHPRR